MDPNSVINLWMCAIRLQDLGRSDEAIQLFVRAVELTQRGALVLGMLGRAYALSGRVDEARAIKNEFEERSQREYIGPGAKLMLVSLYLDNEAEVAAILRENIKAMTGPTVFATCVARDLEG